MKIRNPSRVDKKLFRSYPSLERAENSAEFSASDRTQILEFVRPGTVGAELGVFAGAFSRVILEFAKPRELHLVDPWWVVFGDTYPNWGGYTDYGRLSTRAAYDATVERTAATSGTCSIRIHVAESLDWLQSLPDEFLDWAYLDTTHTYEQTLMELKLLASKVRRDGFILGDDYWIERGNVHYGVVQAVHEFIRTQPFLLIRADRNAQYALRREP